MTLSLVELPMPLVAAHERLKALRDDTFRFIDSCSAVEAYTHTHAHTHTGKHFAFVRSDLLGKTKLQSGQLRIVVR